jgi:hypothetical protein
MKYKILQEWGGIFGRETDDVWQCKLWEAIDCNDC